MRKIKWVDSFRDIPRYREKGLDSSVKGYHNPRTDIVYLIRGKASRATQEHEIYHSIRRDPDKPRTPLNFVIHEIRAYLFSYKKIKQPTHIKGVLRGIYWSLREMYGLSGSQAVKTINVVMRNKTIPATWKRDWVEVKRTG